MFCRAVFASFALVIGLNAFGVSAVAEVDSSSKYRVLSTEKSGLSIITVNILLDHAEAAINTGDLDEAIERLKKARIISKLLINYYRDINGSFRGIDALIPREMSNKNRKVIELFAKANMQLATIHRKKGEPELAVPLLVDVVKILTPINPKAVKAYQQLVELGFVETPYHGERNHSL